MTVGFFHVDRMDPEEHRALAAAMVASVHRTMPGVEVVHFTQPGTDPIRGASRSVVLERAPIALGCLEAYMAAGAGDWLFLDTDVVVQEDVRQVFGVSDFAIAVADRDGTLKTKEIGSKFMARMPYNKGVVFSRSPAFWQAAAEWLRGRKVDDQHWMGDQRAMCETIATRRFSVCVVPARYNYPPFRHNEDLTDKAIVHYKGTRKGWMLERLKACA